MLFAKVVKLKGGADTVGIGFNQNNIPMLSIYLNGEVVQSVNRVRGEVMPCLCINSNEKPVTAEVALVFQHKAFSNGMPSGYNPVVAARGLM